MTLAASSTQQHTAWMRGAAMYGKFFSSTFTGSMYGAGPVVFAVWGFVIANCVDSTVELNPKMLAPMLGATENEVVSAVQYLCDPDPQSRNPSEEGRRLLKTGQFSYQVVTHSHYRAMRNEEFVERFKREANFER